MSVCVLGSINRDIVLRVAELPKPGETVAAHGCNSYLGGKGANQAVAVARMGAAPTFVAATGNDQTSSWMREQLSEIGIDPRHLVTVDGEPSGQAFVLVSDDGQNSIVVTGGANLKITPADLFEMGIANRRVYLSQLETPIDVVAALFSRPDATEGIRVLNAAPAVLEARRLFQLVDILILNETELATYTKTAGQNDEKRDIVGSARALIEHPNQAVVVTLGGAGVIVVRTDCVTHVLGHRVEVVDTTGAGDCFCGVLAGELASGAKLESAVKFANGASALAVTRPGASSSAPTRSEVEAFLRDKHANPTQT